MYGPTETTVWSTLERVTGTEGPITVGRPIANTQIYILDAAGQVTPVGVHGELHIGGQGLADGYWRRPGLTSEKFVANPFSEDETSRLYRTGDLARWRADGTIEILGRIDFQVKLRGFRIELGEIESLMNAQPSVQQSVSLVREDRPGEKRLVAYYVPVGDSDASSHQLRTSLKATLPDYMIPSAFVRMESLPLTANGKIDRKALPEPERLGLNDQVPEYQEPQSFLEQDIARIWRDVLNVDRVGLNDNFFSLGGHSLLATRVIARVNEELHLELPLRVMFEYPTLSELSTVTAEQLATMLEQLKIAVVEE